VRKKIIVDMEAAELIEKTEDYTNQVGYSERTDAAIEPRLSLQWFLKMKDLSQPALEAVLNGEVNLIPDKYVNTYRYWMENVRDWCLSRQLWWGHQIPAYYIQGTNDFVVAPSAEEALEKAKAKTGNANLQPSDLTQDSDVLDTWASSWLWPISVFDGMEHPDNEEFKYYYPTNDLVTAPEILFFWVARMIIAGKTFANGTSPFKNVYLTGIVRDKQRRKMSKSLGNSPDPLELIAQFGADGVRMGMLLCSPAGNDILYDDALVEQGRNFSNKVWNAFRLVKGWEESLSSMSSLREPQGTKGTQGDPDAQAIAWMQARTAQSAAELADGFTKFRLSEVLMTVYKLIWDDFCSNFLEMVKPPYGQSMTAETHRAVLDVFEDLMKLLHPFMPFLSEEVWQGLRPREAGTFLAVSQLTDTLKGAGATDAQHTLVAEMAVVQEAITEIRAFRSSKGLSPREPLALSFKADAAAAFGPYQGLIAKLANVEPVSTVTEKPDGTAGIRVRAYELYLPLGDIDVEAERDKLNKEIAYTEGFLTSVAAKLSNERFVANAKPEIVDNERRKQADAEAKLLTLRAALVELG
jgi:valyl-tRNA synthetase